MFIDKTTRYICRCVLCVILILSGVQFASAQAYRTAVFHPRVKTLQVMVNGDELARPVVALGSDDVVAIEFDELSYVNSLFSYRIVHCNVDWQQSDLSAMEYLDGFDNIEIRDYEYSANTAVNYIHYGFVLNNDDVSITKSGNYAVLIARDNNFEDSVVACACFSVVEPLARIEASVSGNTMAELNGRYQQLSSTVTIDNIAPTSMMNDFVLVVRQNGRPDTDRHLLRPTYLCGNEMEYSSLRELMFEGGNQYRSVDFSSRYTYGVGIDHIEFAGGQYRVVLDASRSRRGEPAVYSQDAFGGFVVNLQGSTYESTEADYMRVYFYYPAEYPYLEGEMYVMGDMTYNLLDDNAKMHYDMAERAYRGELELKQGGYNYIFVLAGKNGQGVTLYPTEGSSWQSRNRYELMLYYRPPTSRYDRLVGYTAVIGY